MRFRVSYQHDSMQCGAACLRMVCKHYGKEYALDFLSEQCGCMIDGVSLQATSRYREHEPNPHRDKSFSNDSGRPSYRRDPIRKR